MELAGGGVGGLGGICVSLPASVAHTSSARGHVTPIPVSVSRPASPVSLSPFPSYNDTLIGFMANFNPIQFRTVLNLIIFAKTLFYINK